ncbi:MAG: hypothetical protein ACRDRL_25025 [Sciscionella sp.]
MGGCLLVVGGAGTVVVAELELIAQELGVGLGVVADPTGDQWVAAALVLVCADRLQAVADGVWMGMLPPRPEGGVVVVAPEDAALPWRATADIAAERVAVLPEDRGWLVEQIRAAGGCQRTRR